MQSKNMPYDIQVDIEKAEKMGAKRGMKVAVWWILERRELNPYGHLTDVLHAREHETEMHAILAEFNLPYKFPQCGKCGRCHSRSYHP